MILLLLGSAAIAGVIGVTLVRAAWPDGVSVRPYRFVVVALGVGAGLGLTSLGVLAWLVVVGAAGRGLIAAELGLCAVLALGWRRRESRRSQGVPAALPAAAASGLATRWIPAACAVTLCCAVAAFVGLSLSQPHGAWDAWMNWNLRARLIFRSGPEWRDAFSALLPWSHPDYPLLVQTSVVRAWIYGGQETLAGSAMVAFLFTFATVALAGSAVAALRGRIQGMLAGLVLLATPFLIFHGTAQYGDVPVGFFFLATVVLLALHDRHREQTQAFAALAGVAAGMAAWTKNEGLLFLLAVAGAWAATGVRAGLRQQLGRDARSFLLGLLPMAAVIGFFKLQLAPPNDLVTATGAGHTLDWVLDPRRYVLVAESFISQIVAFGFNGVISGVWLLLTYGICVGLSGVEVRRRWVLASAACLGLMLAGHAAVLVVAVEDVPRMLSSSLDRLLLQLWPVAVFTWFVVLATPDEASGRDWVPPPATAS